MCKLFTNFLSLILLASGDETDVGRQELVTYIGKLTKKFYKLCNKLFVNDNAHIEEEAYFELCDLLILFNMHSAHKELALEATTNDITLLADYVQTHVFCAEALSERADSSDKIERLHKRRCILAAFAKLVAYNCVPVKYAAGALRHYTRFATSYSDIVKSLLAACREISKIATAKTIALAMQLEYTAGADTATTADNQQQQQRIERTSPQFAALKELAHRFCLSFGPDAGVKSREAIVTIHNEAIAYAATAAAGGETSGARAPPSLSFLEACTEFSSRLAPVDKRQVLAELDRHFARRANKMEENQWQSYYVYRLSLMEDGGAAAAAAAAAAANITAAAAAAAAANRTTAAAQAQPQTPAAATAANTTTTTTTTALNGTASSGARQTKTSSSAEASSSTLASSSGGSGGQRQRARVPASNSILKETINTERNKQLVNRIPEEASDDDHDEGEVVEEQEAGDDEDDENNINEHAEATGSELERLRISHIARAPNESNIINGRLTRASKRNVSIATTITTTTAAGKSVLAAGATSAAAAAAAASGGGGGQKRARSPLVSNNSINESAIDVLTSTRIEPRKTTAAALKKAAAAAASPAAAKGTIKIAARGKSSISIVTMRAQTTATTNENEQDGDGQDADASDAGDDNGVGDDDDDDDSMKSTPSKRTKRNENEAAAAAAVEDGTTDAAAVGAVQPTKSLRTRNNAAAVGIV